MQVIKKDGRIQDLDVTKIKGSILGASIDSNTIINESDLKILSNKVIKTLESLRKNEETTSTYEIFAIIIETLNNEGFDDIALSYLGYKSKVNK